ncbi:hypothetical protein ACQP4Q_04495 [Actinobacillus pleuropneumoniae]|uniref:Uncharacterized protein n=1 Tax=Actinobacillus pleuropneumoniae serotype 3 (strain JL03) TaxID=434271 RepID=B0BPD0_ACTPJ|nr:MULTISPECIES: hypothetical protein [Actinobacillus]ABY69415.1 hypothetical protein APJL_0857 [Actinobacillus pleuropneumoniae serovar 3 str. JL03]KIE91314.1 hypothetical protein AP518_02830 [Actinobacillus pleuropneumoniae]KIE91772.1 hypothetical protein AP1022_02739 [Actinobacillus pleuropneumoniae]KIE92064.1 hypothetical protein AP460_02724 [Actinobacillus pleuropneumoniae]KIE97196.1 hypothetical protein AP5651_02840 [Actinobacillus pleuropneumoniae]
MLKEYIEELGLNPKHTFKQIDLKNSGKRGMDIDLITYEEFDENFQFVRRFTIQDTMSIYPPHNRHISFA